MSSLKQTLSKLLPGLKTYRVAWRSLARFRPPHFRALASFWTPPPGAFVDRPASETTSLNASSEQYFERQENRAFWLNRPYSRPETAGKYLERFGLLLATLAIRPGDKVLDFGCGTGWTSIMLARMGADVLGMDIAPQALEIAREAAARELPEEAGDRLTFTTYAGARIEVPDEGVDFVVVFDAFHHFPNPMEILREFHRVLSPHGRFGFAEPGIGHAASESSVEEAAHGILEQDLDLEQLYRSALDAGFEDLELAIPALEPELLTLPMTRMRSFLRGIPWIVPHDFIRKTVLTGPIGVFRKGPYTVSSLNPRTQVAEIRPEPARLEAAPGAELVVRVRVTNRGDTVWLREGRCGHGYVRLGAHLCDASGATLDHDYARAEIPRDLALGDRATIAIRLRVPETPGRYLIRFDMVNEGVCWFAQHGSPPAELRLEV